MIKFDISQWDRFAGHLFGHINDYYCEFIKTDYIIELNMCADDILEELQSKTSIEEFSPELRKVAEEYWENYYPAPFKKVIQQS